MLLLLNYSSFMLDSRLKTNEAFKHTRKSSISLVLNIPCCAVIIAFHSQIFLTHKNIFYFCSLYTDALLNVTGK